MHTLLTTLNANPNPHPRSNSNPEKVAVTVVRVLRGLSVCFARFSYRENRSRRVVCFPRDVHTCHLRRLYGYDYRHGYTESQRDTDTPHRQPLGRKYTEATTRWGHTFICRHTFIAPARRLLSAQVAIVVWLTDALTDWLNCSTEWLNDCRTDWLTDWRTEKPTDYCLLYFSFSLLSPSLTIV